MLLSQIISGLSYECDCFTDCDISDIVYDSRRAAENTAFVALTGAFTDGHDYIGSAYIKGARVFITERKVELAGDATVIICADTRAALAVISANFFCHPEKELDVIGVTGTKGKTTVTHMLMHCLNGCGIKSGVIGTVGAYYEDKFIPTVNTTPESYELMKLLRLMADAGCKAACLEVSSLGLKSHRVDGIEFSCALFTNFSPDHIGGAEHASIDEYAFWKKQLFKRCRYAVICTDDLFGFDIINELSCKYSTFAVGKNADVTADSICPLRDNNFFGVSFNCIYKGEKTPSKTAMPGIFSVQNALAAAAVCFYYGVTPISFAKTLETVRVIGRDECIPVNADFDVILDYAHNGQSFNSVIDTFSVYKHNRIITVFGSVGDRAQLRRQEMGTVSGKKADLSIITTDDPGFEDPTAICGEIASFVKKAGGEYVIIPDRSQAVKYALSIAKPYDLVLLLGKGHETAQKIKGEKVYYSDREEVEKYFASL